MKKRAYELEISARGKKKAIIIGHKDDTMLSIQKVEMLDAEFDEDGNAIKKEPPKSARQLRRGDTTNEALYKMRDIIDQRKQAKAQKLLKDEDLKI